MNLDELPTLALKQLRGQVGAVAQESIDAILASREKDEKKSDRMDSGWERDYKAYLDALQREGAILGYAWKEFRVRIIATQPGKRDRYYTPEAFVFTRDGVEVHEIKGFQREAGMIRFDAARQRFPHLRWRMFSKSRNGWMQIRGD